MLLIRFVDDDDGDHGADISATNSSATSHDLLTSQMVRFGIELVLDLDLRLRFPLGYNFDYFWLFGSV